MPTIKGLEDQVRSLQADQKSLVADESREWSEKRTEFDKRDADIKSLLEQHKAQKSVDGDPFATAAAAEESAPVAKTFGDQIAESAGHKSAVAAYRNGKRFEESVDLKATILQSSNGAGTVVPTYQPGVIPTLFRRLTVADLMPNAGINGPTLIYMSETAVTNAAATVAEGAAKPQSDVTITQVTELVRKIATTGKISDEMLEDASYIGGYVSGRLVLFVQLAEEDQLLNGNGTAPNLRGLNNRTGLATAVPVVGTGTSAAIQYSDRFDALYTQISNIRATSFLEPDGVIMHPTDWKSLRLAKDANVQYYGGGPFTGAYGTSVMPGDSGTLGENPDVFGCRVVVTPAQPQGAPLVGAFGTATQVFRRSGITVEMTNSNEDDFKNNLVAMRAEERLALAVYRPGAIGKVTGF